MTVYNDKYSEKSFWEKVKKYGKKTGVKVLEPALQLYYMTQDSKIFLTDKAIAYSALGYFIFPLDVIPDIIPVTGYSDDLGILMLAISKLSDLINDQHIKQANSRLADWFGEDSIEQLTYSDNRERVRLREISPGKCSEVIFVDGYLTENDKSCIQDWRAIKKFRNNRRRYFQWDSRDNNIKKNIKKTTKSNLLFVNPSSLLTSTTTALFYNEVKEWKTAVNRAEDAGKKLASIICQNNRPCILVGHSLGARVIYHCLKELRLKEKKLVIEVYLLGGAIDTGDPYKSFLCTKETHKWFSEPEKAPINWILASQAVKGRVFNCYSKKDEILRLLYNTMELSTQSIGRNPIIGRDPIECKCKGIVDVNISTIVEGHSEYIRNFDKFT